jgi:hypothetical protein
MIFGRGQSWHSFSRASTVIGKENNGCFDPECRESQTFNIRKPYPVWIAGLFFVSIKEHTKGEP